METNKNASLMIYNIQVELNPSRSTPCKNIIKVNNERGDNCKVNEYTFSCVDMTKFAFLGDDIIESCIMCHYCT